MKIADNFANYDENHEDFDYFDEEFEEYGYSEVKDETKDEVKTESKVPMDKFGWFYKACVITSYLNLIVIVFI